MIDLHAHILPGYDDGVRSLEEARELARTSAADGVTAIAATPHVRADYPTTAERMLRGVRRLADDFAAEDIPVTVISGGEVDVRHFWELGAGELERFTIAGNGRWLLLETPYRGWPDLLGRTVTELHRRGIDVLLAHPERNDEVQRDPSRVAALVENGVRVQLTAASVDGRLGGRAETCARALLDRGLAHVLASDAHHPGERQAGFAAAATVLGDPALVRRLTLEAPAAIVAGADLPP